MGFKDDIKKLKETAPYLAAASPEARNKALESIAAALKCNADKIFEANKIDLENAEKDGISASIVKRLKFDEKKLSDCTGGIEQLISLPDPLGKVTLARQLDEGLELFRYTCPIGVIGVIFESRPDALVQISSLCLKSGNCAVLKGGKESVNTNRVLFDVIYDAAVRAGLPEGCLLQAEQHSEIDELLKCHEYVDLLIPRGSNQFVQYIMNNTKIPVMGHADGICHTYVDDTCDADLACKVIVDAKTQYTAACNATETLLISRKNQEIVPELIRSLKDAGVFIRGTAEVDDLAGVDEVIGDDDFETEYLDMKIGVKMVDGVDEAIAHINKFGSHHTDCIISDNDRNIERFMQLVDSAGVYANCSTRFADGFRYGFGAEVGISTGKIHARGPVGLEGLVTYKYTLHGHGQTVADYASGKAQFNFRDLD